MNKYFYLGLILFVLFRINATAQDVLFEPSRLHYPVAGLPWAVETGDFNKDGNIDFVIPSRLERRITLRLGNGDGTFGDSLGFGVGISPRSLIPGDFNEDTNLDVAVANLLSNDVTVLFGDGNGDFPTTNTYIVGDKPRSIITADFNSDNHLDLAIANRDDNSISILLGVGDGFFIDTILLNTTSEMNPRQVRSGDLNNDNKLDLVLVHDEQMGSSVGQKYGVLLGRGDGTFDPITVYVINAGNGFPEAVSLTLGKFNADQNLDMVISLYNSAIDEIVSFIGNGDGTFTLLDVISVGSAPFHIINYDLSKDGFPDIIVSNTGNSRITIHTNRGDATFRNEIPGGDLFDYLNGTFRVGKTPRWITIADVNNDQKIDLLTANEESNDVSVLIGDTDTTFVLPDLYNVGSPPQAFPSGGDTGDFNRDGYLDLAISNWGFIGPSDVSVLLNAGDGTFLPKTNYTVGKNPKKVIAKDFDGDTFLDLAVLNSRDSVFSLVTGKGDGTFNESLSFSTKPNPALIVAMTDMASGDFNEDDLEDIVIINYNEDYLGLFLGNQQTVFSEVEKIFLSNARPERLLVADFNDDDNQDILVQKDAEFLGQPNVLDVYLGDGNGGFSSPIENTWSGENTTRIITADFDNDNVLDIVIIDSKFEITLFTLIFFKGNNDGSFTQANTIELNNPGTLFAYDLVGDTNIDLLVGSSANADVTILEGNGDFTFAELWPSYGTGINNQYIIPGDFDKDNDLDLATSGGIGGDSYISILYNTQLITNVWDNSVDKTPTSFALEQNYPNPFNPNTTIQYSIKENTLVSLKIYDILGNEVKTLVNEQKPAGFYEVQFDASRLSSGIYFYKLRAGKFIETKKMVLLR
ncbi:MAG: T9SS type A sorting domain-containing protein [Ignavibacteria bacterium]|nr:T9SS type A sorting domain-containing protein [Ignavibacteria bacterium]